MKQLKLYQKGRIIFIAIILLLAIKLNAQGNLVKESDIQIINVGLLHDTNLLWVKYYIIIDSVVYSGDIFDGRNYTCLDQVPMSFIDTININLFKDNLFLFTEKIDQLKYNYFKTMSSYVNDKFYWKCINTHAKYIFLPCNVTTQDFFSFLYNQQYNGIQIINIDMSKFVETKLPEFFISKVETNDSCLQKLGNSYGDFINCIR